MMLRIRIGASADRSLDTAPRAAVRSAERTAAQLEAIARRQARTQEAEARRAAKATEREWDKAKRDVERYHREVTREAERSASRRMRVEQQVAREAIRETERVARAHERSERQRASLQNRSARAEGRAQHRGQRDTYQSGLRQDAALRAGLSLTGGLALRGMGAAGSFALGATRDLIQGAGVDTDFGSMVRKNVALESSADKLSNSGFIAGDRRNGARVDKADLMRDAFRVGKETGLDANDAVEGLTKFTAKTGDLATGREIMKDMAILSRATGTNLEDMVDAAGDISTAIGDVPNKAELINSTMKAIAGQGKLGAVEIKNLATQMAKLAANATQIEGDSAKNMIIMGAFAQEARQRGGASSATMAATSAAGLIDIFKTPARANAFKSATGKDVFNAQGMLRNPEELVIEALRASGMKPTEFKKIFSNKAGGRAVEGYASIYRSAGGGEAGEAAVRAEMARLRDAVMQDVEVMESFRRSMQTTEAQANVFNNSMRESAQKIQDIVIPSLLELAPAAVSATQSLVRVADFTFGTDARNRANQRDTETRVDTAGRETNRQLGRGYILDQQEEINRQNEKVAHENMIRAKAEADVAKKNLATDESSNSPVGQSVRQIMLSTFGGPLAGLVGIGMSAGEDMFNTTQKDVDKKNEAAQKAMEIWEKAQGQKERVADLLENHVIQVKVVEDITKKRAGEPPELGSGRDPDPGTP